MLSQRRFIYRTYLVRILLTASFLSSIKLWADVVYLKNGDVFLVDKAWEFQEEIKYQVGESVKSIPKSQVLRITVEKGKQQEGQTRKYGFGVEASSPSTSTPVGPPVELFDQTWL